jgi:hypothetical protein
MNSARSPDDHAQHADAKSAQRQGLLRAPPKFLPEREQEYMQAEYTPGMLLGFLRVIVPFVVLLLLGTATAEYGKMPEDCWEDPSGGGALWERRTLIAAISASLIWSLLVALVAITTPAQKYWRLHEWCGVSWVLVAYVTALAAEVSRDNARGMLPWKAGELHPWCKHIRHINVTMARRDGSWRYHRVCHDEDPLNTLRIAPHQFAGCEFFVRSAKNTVSVCVGTGDKHALARTHVRARTHEHARARTLELERVRAHPHTRTPTPQTR